MTADIRIIAMLMRMSRVVNGLTGGSFDEMLCSRLWRSSYGKGRAVLVIDAIMFRLRGERDHCRNCTIFEFHRTAQEPVEEDNAWDF